MVGLSCDTLGGGGKEGWRIGRREREGGREGGREGVEKGGRQGGEKRGRHGGKKIGREPKRDSL